VLGAWLGRAGGGGAADKYSWAAIVRGRDEEGK